MIAAYNIGYANYNQLYEQAKQYVKNGLFRSHNDVVR